MFDDLVTGIVIDRSAFSADDCNLAIVAFANTYGFTIGTDDESVIDRITRERTYRSAYESPEENDHQALHELADNAVQWMNDNNTREGYTFNIDNNSLYFEEIDNDYLDGTY